MVVSSPSLALGLAGLPLRVPIVARSSGRRSGSPRTSPETAGLNRSRSSAADAATTPLRKTPPMPYTLSSKVKQSKHPISQPLFDFRALTLRQPKQPVGLGSPRRPTGAAHRNDAGRKPQFSSLLEYPRMRRAMIIRLICCVPSKMSLILASRIHFSRRHLREYPSGRSSSTAF